MTTPHRLFRYRFLDNQGDRVEIILAEPGSIFVRSHDAAFAALWKAPPGDLRTWLSTMDITYATANLLVRSGCRFARTKKLDAAFTRDIAKWWGAFQAVLWVELAAPVAPTPCTRAIGACDLHEPVSLADGEHEAALAAARREERERVCALFAPLFEMGASVAEIAEVVKTLDEKKGQAK